MAKKTVRTGVIGAGFSAAFHYEALQKVTCVDVEVVGVYARTPQRAEAFYRSIVTGEPAESDLQLAADAIITMYSAYVSARRAGAAVDIPLLGNTVCYSDRDR